MIAAQPNHSGSRTELYPLPAQVEEDEQAENQQQEQGYALKQTPPLSELAAFVALAFHGEVQKGEWQKDETGSCTSGSSIVVAVLYVLHQKAVIRCLLPAV